MGRVLVLRVYRGPGAFSPVEDLKVGWARRSMGEVALALLAAGYKPVAYVPDGLVGACVRVSTRYYEVVPRVAFTAPDEDYLVVLAEGRPTQRGQGAIHPGTQVGGITLHQTGEWMAEDVVTWAATPSR